MSCDTKKTIEDHKGDSGVLKFIHRNKTTKTPIDITGYKILCEISDEINNIKKATANVTGGSDTQIKITDAVNGKFEIYIDKNETDNFSNNSNIEIALLIGSSKDTLYQKPFNLKDVKITWETIP